MQTDIKDIIDFLEYKELADEILSEPENKTEDEPDFETLEK